MGAYPPRDEYSDMNLTKRQRESEDDKGGKFFEYMWRDENQGMESDMGSNHGDEMQDLVDQAYQTKDLAHEGI